MPNNYRNACEFKYCIILPNILGARLLEDNVLIGVELFAGAGGLSLGAEKAGVSVSHAIENSKSAAETYAKNHKGTALIFEDVRAIDPKQLATSREGLILFGGPPCQGFSTSNQKNRGKKNENNWLFLEFLRFVEALTPKVVLFENVSGIVHTSEGYFFRELLTRLESLGYIVSYAVLDASKCGVPQKRNRFFCVASLSKKIVLNESIGKKYSVTVDDAIHDLPNLEMGSVEADLPYKCASRSEYASRMRGGAKTCTGHLVTKNSEQVLHRYKHIPQGGNWENVPTHLMGTYKDVSRCHTGIYRRLEANKPSIVLGNFRKNMLIHPYEDRGLSVREAARIQSFPDSYEFTGSIGFQQQQVGNAVPPMMAEAVFTEILTQLRANY